MISKRTKNLLLEVSVASFGYVKSRVAAFLTQKCRLETRMIKFEIWDTAGQERFHSLAPMYYRYAHSSFTMVLHY